MRGGNRPDVSVSVLVPPPVQEDDFAPTIDLDDINQMSISDDCIFMMAFFGETLLFQPLMLPSPGKRPPPVTLLPLFKSFTRPFGRMLARKPALS